MRFTLLAALLISSGCDTRPRDGAKPLRAAALDAQPAAPPQVVVDAAPLPAGPVTEQQAVTELDALGDELCACPDLDCAFGLDPRIALLQQRFAGVKDTDRDRYSKPVRKAAERFAARAKECMARLKTASGGENAAVLAMHKVADDVCACADLACARAAMKRAEGTLAKYDQVKGSAADQEKILQQLQRMAQCRNRLTPPD